VALGQQGELMALLCQPAEVQPSVAIPPNVRFWGVDSGVTVHEPTAQEAIIPINLLEQDPHILSAAVKDQQYR